MTTEDQLRQQAADAMAEYLLLVADRTDIKVWALQEPWGVRVAQHMETLVKHEVAHFEQQVLASLLKKGNS